MKTLKEELKIRRTISRLVDLFMWITIIFFIGFITYMMYVVFEKPENEWMITKIHTAQVNGEETVIYEHANGTKGFAVQYEHCEDVATITGYVENCDREIIHISH